MERKRKLVKSTQPSMQMVWLRAEYEFASTFSYRQPDVSAQFALGTPIPSPATIKLTLVDTAIRWSGDVGKGRKVFEQVKLLPVHPIPPERVIRFRSFIKRLKPREGKLLESTGVRDYFLLDGPMTVFVQVPKSEASLFADLLCKIRRLGTSDSLCWCRDVMCDSAPDFSLCPQPMDKQDEKVLQQILAQSFVISRLSDLTEKSQFEGFNPFNGRTALANLDKRAYLLPLKLISYGETWALLERSPLPQPTLTGEEGDVCPHRLRC